MANGNFAGGTGTELDPYLIEDAFDLDAVRNDLTAHYKVTNNIDLNVSPFNEGEGWIPIGSSAHSFTGQFDGGGYKIANLFINRSSVSYQGLFASVDVSNTKINKVDLIDVSVAGYDMVGSLVGSLGSSVLIKNCNSTGSITGRNSLGGLIGNVTNSFVEDCYSHCSVTSSYSYAGGLIGKFSNYSELKNSYSTGKVVVSETFYSGGLIGYVHGSSTKVLNSFWDKEASGWTTSKGGTGKTTAEMQDPTTFSTWDANIWKLKEGSYPKLFFEMISYYAEQGTWESPVIDLGEGWSQTILMDIQKQINEGITDCVIDIAYSSDGVSFSDYALLDSANPPQARFIQLKATLTATPESAEVNALTTEQINDLLDSSNTLRFAHYLEQDQLTDTVNVDLLSVTSEPVAKETPTLDSVKIMSDELTIEGRMQDIEKINAVNIAKLNFKSNALVGSSKYQMADMVVDTFEDNTTVDTSSTATYDSVTKEFVGASSPTEVVLPEETLPTHRKKFLFNTESEGNVSYQYTLDGTTWNAITPGDLIDLSGVTGNKLKIKAILNDSTAKLRGVAASWV